MHTMIIKVLSQHVFVEIPTDFPVPAKNCASSLSCGVARSGVGTRLIEHFQANRKRKLFSERRLLKSHRISVRRRLHLELSRLRDLKIKVGFKIAPTECITRDFNTVVVRGSLELL